jgi:hypothetical protein
MRAQGRLPLPHPSLIIETDWFSGFHDSFTMKTDSIIDMYRLAGEAGSCASGMHLTLSAGNAVPVPVAAAIGSSIRRALMEHYKRTGEFPPPSSERGSPEL